MKRKINEMPLNPITGCQVCNSNVSATLGCRCREAEKWANKVRNGKGAACMQTQACNQARAKGRLEGVKWTIEQAEKMSSSRCSGHGMFDDYVALKRLKQLLQGQDDED